MSPLFRDRGIIGAAIVLIPGSAGAFGVLDAATTHSRSFTQDDVNFLQAIANVLGAALERRRAENEVQQSRAMFQGLFESSPDAVVVVDRAGRITRVNAQIERLFGYSRDELAGQLIEILMPERGRQAHVGQRESYWVRTADTGFGDRAGAVRPAQRRQRISPGHHAQPL